MEPSKTAPAKDAPHARDRTRAFFFGDFRHGSGLIEIQELSSDVRELAWAQGARAVR